MKLNQTWTGLLVSGLLLAGCGSSGTNEQDGTTIDLPDGKVLVFFDNVSSAQYQYDTDSEMFEDMNIAGENYDMTEKHGKLVMWHHVTETSEDQKIVMFREDFDINEGDVTYEDFHYLGHFHEENNEKHFAAHSAEEFNPENNASAAMLAALDALSEHLAEQEAIKMEIEEALPTTETLCNFYVPEHAHETADANMSEETTPHFALTVSGKLYILEEENGLLSQIQAPVILDGVTACEEDQSSILESSDHGVLVFSAQSQKLYLVDNHGLDYHNHSTWDISRFLPEGFTPTMVTGIGEGAEHDHAY